MSNRGEVRNRKTRRILSQYTDRDGYKHVSICVNKKQYHRGVHRFVACAFIENPENKPEVNHKNGIKSDNNVENLERATTAENVQHAFDTGLKSAVVGSDNSLSHYTDGQIHAVCKFLEEGFMNKTISKLTGVDRKYITDIKKGRRWKHISSKYKIESAKYSDKMKKRIISLLSNGLKTQDIIQVMNLENTQAHRSLIERLKRQI